MVQQTKAPDKPAEVGTKGTEVTVSPQKSLMTALSKAQAAIQDMLPRHLTPERMLRLTMLVANKTPKLLECDPLDVVAAVVDASRLGLEIGSHAHLVPFYNNTLKKMQVVMIPDFKGIADLARRSGAVDSIDARVVYRGERFEVSYGTEPKVVHIPDFEVDRSDSNVLAFYMVAHLPGEALPKFDVMTKLQVDGIMARSKTKDSGPWRTDYQEMGKKTIVKRGCKLLPQSPELAAALEYDNRVESGDGGTANDILDTPESIAAFVKDKTQARAEDLKNRIGAAKAAEKPAETEEERVRREDKEMAASGGAPLREPGEEG